MNSEQSLVWPLAIDLADHPFDYDVAGIRALPAAKQDVACGDKLNFAAHGQCFDLRLAEPRVGAVQVRGLRRSRSGGWRKCSDIGFVHEAPAPIFPRLKRLDDGMADQDGVPPRVTPRGCVAAADVPARKTQPQMHPPHARFQALLAALRRAWIHRTDEADVRIGDGHVVPRQVPRPASYVVAPEA